MIAIPNMDKPKSCKVCPFTCEKLAFFDGKNRPQGCPIIEIDEKAFNEVIKGCLEGLKAIQNGERRSNDTD